MPHLKKTMKIPNWLKIVEFLVEIEVLERLIEDPELKWMKKLLTEGELNEQ